MAVRPEAIKPISFASAQDESKLLKKLGSAKKVQVRLSQPDDQDVEGHLYLGNDKVVLASVALDDDDVEGHVISIHFPDAEQARHFRNQLIAAGALTATLALGIGAGSALAPNIHVGTAEGVAPTTASQTFTGIREGGQLSIVLPGVGAVNPDQAAADAARVNAGITGSLAGSQTAADSPTRAREAGPLSSAAVNPQAAADAARANAGISGSLAGVDSTAADSPTLAREGGSLSVASTESVAAQAGDSIAERAGQIGQAGTVNPAAAADAARTQVGITGSLAGSNTAADSPTRAREGGSLSFSEAAAKSQAAMDAGRSAAGISGFQEGVDSGSAAAAASSTIAGQAGDSIAERAAQVSGTTVNPQAAADAARAAAGIHGSLAGVDSTAADSPTLAREGGSLSVASTDSIVGQAGDSMAERAAQASSTSGGTASDVDTAAKAREGGSLSSTTTPRAGDSIAERGQSGTTDEGDGTPNSGFQP